MVLSQLKTMLGWGMPPRPQVPTFKRPSGTIAEQWQAWYDFNLQQGGYRVLLGPKLDPFPGWDAKLCYGWKVELDLMAALDLRYVGKEPDVGAALLERALAVAARTRADRALEHFEDCDMLRLERGEAYARWMLTGVLDRKMLDEACRYAMKDAAQPCYREEGEEPEEAEKANAFVRDGTLLQAARVALVTQRWERAREALQACGTRSGALHRQMRDGLTLAAQTPEQSKRDARQSALREVGELLDRLRPLRPRIPVGDFWGPRDVAAFELAVIHAQLEAGTGEPPDLETVCRKVSAP